MRNLMLGLARPLMRLLGRDERGGVAVLVAVLISGGVLLGVGALALDVGQLYQNRAELQSGAEAAALAVARSCVASTCAPGVAPQYANANASALTGHLAAIDLVCGSGSLSACPASTGTMTDCPPPPASGNYVDVHTSTQTPSGTLLPPVLARTLLGNGSYSGTNVKACAQAEWGGADQSNSLAITISVCAWQGLVGTDTDGDASNSVDTDGDSDDNGAFNTPIALYIKGKSKPCAGPGGGNVAGGFDWLNTDTDNDGENTSDTDNDGDASGSCTAFINLVTSTTYNNTGNNVSSACQTALENDIASYLAGNPVTVYLPVFDSVSGTGTNASYQIIGLAGFVITGYSHMPYNPQQDGINSICGTSSSTSGNNAPCIQGYFKPGLDPVGSIGGGTNFGAIAVQLTG